MNMQIRTAGHNIGIGGKNIGRYVKKILRPIVLTGLVTAGILGADVIYTKGNRGTKWEIKNGNPERTELGYFECAKAEMAAGSPHGRIYFPGYTPVTIPGQVADTYHRVKADINVISGGALNSKEVLFDTAMYPNSFVGEIAKSINK